MSENTEAADKKKQAEEIINDLFEKAEFTFVKRLQILCAMWPYNSKIQKYFIRILLLGGLAPLFIVFEGGITMYCGNNLNFCAENILAMLYLLFFYSKYIIIILIEDKLIHMYLKISKNRKDTEDDAEKKIIVKYTKQGKRVMIGYGLVYGVATAGFLLLPTAPKILDFVAPLNESREPLEFINGKYPFDQHQYFTECFIYFAIMTYCANMAWVGADLSFMLIVYQIVCYFAVVKYRIRQATLIVDSKTDVSYDKIRSAIQLHQESLDFVRYIQDAFTIFLLILICGTVLFCSLGAVIITDHDGSNFELVKITLIVITAALHLLYYTWPGQLMVDHSTALFTDSFSTEWHTVSSRSKRLLLIYMMRCSDPVMFTASGLYIMSLENFGSVMKTTVSYITVVKSFK